jgi:hypothetical protein
MRRIWIAEVHVSADTRRKITLRHGPDVDDLLARLIGASGLTYAWHFHPQRGWRVIVEVPYGPARVLVVLYPAGDIEEETWHLGSAYRSSLSRRPRRGRMRP